MAEPTPVDQLTFKQASVELEQIVSSLERGDLAVSYTHLTLPTIA